MKIKTNLFIVCILVSTLVLSTSCKRSGVDYPAPTGPSTIAVILTVSTSPNVILAGVTRQMSTITANLRNFQGVALANETIHFDIRDETGEKAYLGFFEGNLSVASRMTDSSGNVSLNYFGPLVTELAADAQVYIYAWVEWEGKEYIIEYSPVYVVRDIIEIEFNLFANPNVLWATAQRPESQIIGTLKKLDGIPVQGWTVFFKITSGPGKFSDGTVNAFGTTDATGMATVTYVGPTKNELTEDIFVTIKGQPQTSSPNYAHEEVQIRVKKGPG